VPEAGSSPRKPGSLLIQMDNILSLRSKLEAPGRRLSLPPKS